MIDYHNDPFEDEEEEEFDWDNAKLYYYYPDRISQDYRYELRDADEGVIRIPDRIAWEFAIDFGQRDRLHPLDQEALRLQTH